MSYSELRLVLPKDARVNMLTYAIWAGGIKPFSWAMQCGPDFLPIHDPVLQAGWQAYEIQQRREYAHDFDEALRSEVARAEAILAEQGMVLAESIEQEEQP